MEILQLIIYNVFIGFVSVVMIIWYRSYKKKTDMEDARNEALRIVIEHLIEEDEIECECKKENEEVKGKKMCRKDLN
jgi:hypothetical protein